MALRRRFQYNLDLKDCIPSTKNENLRIMLLVSHGTLCVLDGLEAGFKSGGNALVFVLNLNIIAWFRLIKLVLKEISIRAQIDYEAIKDEFRKINVELNFYLNELKKYDLEAFKKEKELLEDLNLFLEETNNLEEINKYLMIEIKNRDIILPYSNGEEFYDFMIDDEQELIF